MLICGLQKLSLLDFPGKTAATVFTGGCNFRCPFCHNAGLVTEVEKSMKMDTEDIFAFLKKRKNVLDGVAITGGEPLLQPDISEFIARIKDMGYLVKLDTNGSFPEKLREIAESGNIDYVAMDIKNSPEKYALTIGRKTADLESINESVEFLLGGSLPYEFRTTVVRELHENEDFEKIGEWIHGAEKYFLQQFTDSGNLLTYGWTAYTKDEMSIFCDTVRKNVPSCELRGV